MTKSHILDRDARRWFEKAQIQHRRWEFGRDTLYKMCAATRHDDINATMSKLWLIGRSHSAALERSHTPSETYATTYEKTARRMAARGKLDQLLDNVTRAGRSSRACSIAQLQAARDIVEYLTDLFFGTTGQRKISLASKYLHFHQSAIPIFDSISAAVLRQLVPKRDIAETHRPLITTTYGLHLARFGHTFDTLIASGYTPTTRTLDNLLLYLGTRRSEMI